ncbi:MAG TPA: hypothetical protein VGN64_19565 [Dyadobacter sp.]|jgi:hypothetical protein|nr:hypothetical protein [Dyadobacter sp.]
MKTDKFEKTIRQKLESISPDFHEDNWAQMQQYMHVHNPPGFWQQYGSWLGYAAAASVTTVMAFMYTNQLSQTNELKRDLTELRKEVRLMTPEPVATRADTVYIVQKEIVHEPVFVYPKEYTSQRLADVSGHNTPTGQHHSEVTGNNTPKREAGATLQKPEAVLAHNPDHEHEVNQAQVNKAEYLPGTETRSPSGDTQSNFATGLANSNPASASKTLDGSFSNLSELVPVTPENGNARSLKYTLANRMSPRQTRKVWLASAAPVTKSAVVEDKKVEKTAKADNIIPQLNIKAPYRFGAGFQFEGNNQVKTVVGEVLVGKRFSIATGLSWLRIKPMHFKSEKIFKEKNKGDFKQMHPGEVPMTFAVKNINVSPTLLQIPLTVAFRNDVTKDFSYFVGAGTNVTLNGKEKITYDCFLPITGKEFTNQTLERKMNIPLFNSMNVTAGIEKSWHPIVIQIEGYVYSYFKPLTPMTQKTGPGVKMKLLYQIGKKM